MIASLLGAWSGTLWTKLNDVGPGQTLRCKPKRLDRLERSVEVQSLDERSHLGYILLR